MALTFTNKIWIRQSENLINKFNTTNIETLSLKLKNLIVDMHPLNNPDSLFRPETLNSKPFTLCYTKREKNDSRHAEKNG